MRGLRNKKEPSTGSKKTASPKKSAKAIKNGVSKDPSLVKSSSKNAIKKEVNSLSFQLESSSNTKQLNSGSLPIEGTRRVALDKADYSQGNSQACQKKNVSDISVGSDFLQGLSIHQANAPGPFSVEDRLKPEPNLFADTSDQAIDQSFNLDSSVEVNLVEHLKVRVSDVKKDSDGDGHSILKHLSASSDKAVSDGLNVAPTGESLPKKKSKTIQKTETQTKELSEFLGRSIRTLATCKLLYQDGHSGFETPVAEVISPEDEVNTDSSDLEELAVTNEEYKILKEMTKEERRKRKLSRVVYEQENRAKCDMKLGSPDARNTYEFFKPNVDPDVYLDSSNIKTLPLEDIMEEITALKDFDRPVLEIGFLLIHHISEAHYSDTVLRFQQIAHDLGATAATVFDTMNIFYKLLTKVRVKYQHLFKILIACFVIASKHNTQYAPDLNAVLKSLPEFEAEEIEKVEHKVLEALGYSVTIPNYMEYINLLNSVDKNDFRARILARYILEQSLYNPRLANYSTASVACGAYHLAVRILMGFKWNETHTLACGFTRDDLNPVSLHLFASLKQSEKLSNNFLFKKYSFVEYYRSSRLVKYWMDQVGNKKQQAKSA